MAPGHQNSDLTNRYPYEPPTFRPESYEPPTDWRPTRKFVAGLLTAIVYLSFDVITTGGLTREHLGTVLPQLTVLAAFYMVPDRS